MAHSQVSWPRAHQASTRLEFALCPGSRFGGNDRGGEAFLSWNGGRGDMWIRAWLAQA